MEILPILSNKYLPVYEKIIEYNQSINECESRENLKSLKDEIVFRYEIPNRQFLSEKIDKKIRSLSSKQTDFILRKESIISNLELYSAIRRASPDLDLSNSDLEKAREFSLKDITKDECSLSVKYVRNNYRFRYIGDEKDSLFKYLKENNVE